MSIIDRKSRPPLCPCPNSCKPVYNGLADEDGPGPKDLIEGKSGDCVGCGDMQTYDIGGVLHKNDMNQCIFTPLKGITQYKINEGDIHAMSTMYGSILYELRPKKECAECGTSGRHVHWVNNSEGVFCCECFTKRFKT